MQPKRLENKNFILTVEGECEKKYFEHLKRLINSNEDRKYNCTFKPDIAVKKDPVKCARQAPVKNGTYYHIQDIEDANDEYEYNKFIKLLDSLDEANEIVDYDLGYTNYSFDLWMVLHKIKADFQVPNRKKYIDYINKGYKTSYCHIDDYKKENEFIKILNKITLDDVKFAIKNGKEIRMANDNHQSPSVNQKKISYKGYSFYKENPDLDIQLIVENIIKECF